MKAKERKEISRQWEQFFISKGIEEKLTEAYMLYIKKLLDKNLPPIFDFRHLCLLLGINKADLAVMINSPDRYYREFQIPKRSGGLRTITAPYPSLKYVQRWIYDNVLKHIKVHGCAHGFVSGRSILTNANIHVGQHYMLKIDLKDFFPSIPIHRVIQLFSSIGYKHQVSFYLASLCCYDGRLAQGSPVSPVISNIVAIHMDRRLYRLAKQFGLKYSRYADDIAFSGEMIAVKFIEYVKRIIQECGFVINERKIRLYKEHGNKIVTGVSLATGTPRLPRDYRRRLEKELYYINKYGLRGHIAHNKIRQPHYLESIIGKIGYWLMIEPNNIFAKQIQDKLIKEYRRKINDEKIRYYECENKTSNS